MVYAVLSALDRYTRHGLVYIVPDFVGQDHHAIVNQYSNQFTFVISDSLYQSGAAYGTVLQQDPLPGSKVKRGRNVYFIIVSQQPEKVLMPNLLNLSLRQALVSLESSGLVVNTLSFTEHFARNAIVSQLFEGTVIEPGTAIYRGSPIELVLGNGGNLEKVPFPMLYGKKKAEVRRLLHSLALNVGNEYFLDGADTIHSRVYKTEPSLRPGAEIMPGTFVTIWYRSEKQVDFKTFIRDSLYIDELQTDLIDQENTEENL